MAKTLHIEPSTYACLKAYRDTFKPLKTRKKATAFIQVHMKLKGRLASDTCARLRFVGRANRIAVRCRAINTGSEAWTKRVGMTFGFKSEADVAAFKSGVIRSMGRHPEATIRFLRPPESVLRAGKVYG